MKNKINILLACLVVVGMIACDTAGGIDADIFQPGESAALAVWVSSPDGDLLLSDPTSSVDFEVEFIDATDGSSVESFALLVETRDADGNVTSSGTVLTESSFTASANGNQGFSGQFDLNDVVTALGSTVATYSEKDNFYFTTTITVGGVVYPTGNANQFLQSIRDFTIALPVETVDVTVSITNSKLNGTATEWVVMAFSNDFTVELETLPTLEILNGGGGTFGAVQAVLDEDGMDSVYRSLYTPGAVEEAITFRIINASAVAAAGFAMVADTSKSAFTIDLTAPTIIGDLSATSATGQLYNFLMSEDIGKVTLTENYTGVDDDEDGTIDDATDAVAVDVTFTDNVLDFKYAWTATDGEVTLTLEVWDTAGNALTLPAGLATVVLN